MKRRIMIFQRRKMIMKRKMTRRMRHLPRLNSLLKRRFLQCRKVIQKMMTGKELKKGYSNIIY
uniref:Candidate secreted effector n=1 Tax=Meloidogyne incognita TaxID=6306 RepID=A0A914N2Z7_MELIC